MSQSKTYYMQPLLGAQANGHTFYQVARQVNTINY